MFIVSGQWDGKVMHDTHSKKDTAVPGQRDEKEDSVTEVERNGSYRRNLVIETIGVDPQ